MIETVDTGADQVSRRAVINAPIGELFAIVADPHRHHEIDGSGTVGATIEGAHKMVKGEPFSTKMKMFGLSYRTTSTPTQVEENSVIEWQVGGRQKWRYEFREIDANTTEVTETWDVRGVTGAKLMGLLMGKRNGNGMAETLRRLQQRYA